MDQSAGTSVDDGTTEGGLARNRSRREKKDRYGRKAALEQFREARSGQRPRYVISEEHNIYDEVDEEEYSKIVRGRQDDDWIVDDGTGYVEDGREIFDDDAEAVETGGKKRKAATNAKPAKNPNIRPTDSKPKSIRGMFAAAAAKPKVQKAVSLDDDDILGDIMGELKKGDTQTIRPAPVKILRQIDPVTVSSTMNTVERNGYGGVTAKKFNTESHNGSAPPASRVLRESGSSSKSTRNSAQHSRHVKAEHDYTEKSSHQPKSGNVLPPESQQIEEFASQDLFESDRHSEVIEDFASAVCNEVDVSGIDFNDNFEQELPVNKVSGVFAG